MAWAAAAIFGMAACGGGSATPPAATAPPKARSAARAQREPIRVDFDAQRFGSSLRLDVRGIGRGVLEGEPFEDPERWHISAQSADGAELPRLVNGPVRIDRSPVGGARSNQWDTTVQFSVVYEVPAGAESVHVQVRAPQAPPLKRVVAL